ncbi:unnamed protein product [Caenorhabditis angaria]|uniref:Uncharacterized protein n=1 Tax=Caenorhabditis angaria TaxID=860376 RepID=A0A9P1IMY8_9PELO|nr:unnamed protein product [Caenorhabditis angaria]
MSFFEVFAPVSYRIHPKHSTNPIPSSSRSLARKNRSSISQLAGKVGSGSWLVLEWRVRSISSKKSPSPNLTHLCQFGRCQRHSIRLHPPQKHRQEVHHNLRTQITGLIYGTSPSNNPKVKEIRCIVLVTNNWCHKLEIINKFICQHNCQILNCCGISSRKMRRIMPRFPSKIWLQHFDCIVLSTLSSTKLPEIFSLEIERLRTIHQEKHHSEEIANIHRNGIDFETN